MKNILINPFTTATRFNAVFLACLCLYSRACFAQASDETIVGVYEGNLLLPCEDLWPGDQLNSPDGNHILRLEGDGSALNLYSLKAPDQTHPGYWWKVTWTVKLPKDGSGKLTDTAEVLTMQADGNLVIYDVNWQPFWASGTELGNGSHNGAYLKMQNDGNLVIYPKTVDTSLADNATCCAYWNTGTSNQ